MCGRCTLTIDKSTSRHHCHVEERRHPTPLVGYAFTDCSLKAFNPDDTSRDVNSKADSAMAVPTTPSHHAENVGASDCQIVLVERKLSALPARELSRMFPWELFKPNAARHRPCLTGLY